MTAQRDVFFFSYFILYLLTCCTNKREIERIQQQKTSAKIAVPWTNSQGPDILSGIYIYILFTRLLIHMLRREMPSCWRNGKWRTAARFINIFVPCILFKKIDWLYWKCSRNSSVIIFNAIQINEIDWSCHKRISGPSIISTEKKSLILLSTHFIHIKSSNNEWIIDNLSVFGVHIDMFDMQINR